MAVKTNSKVTGVKSSSIAMFEGTFAGILGLGVAILWSLRTTVDYTAATNSLLEGMVFGLAAGIVSVMVLPFVYFAFGWIIGYVHGFVFNVVAESSGGIVLRLDQSNK